MDDIICVRCTKRIVSLKLKYKKSDGDVCKNCYEKEYRKLNKEKLNKWHKQYADSHRDTINKQARDRYNDPNHKRKTNQGEWIKQNWNKVLENSRREYRRKYKKDPQWTMSKSIRRRFAAALKNNSKRSSTWEYVGCSYQEFIYHIESLWSPGMEWGNYGEWQIDHIDPIFKFDHSDEEQVKKVWNYKNMQPLWYADHLVKTKKDLYG